MAATEDPRSLLSILIVDDEQRLCELLAKLLELRGYHVRSAVSAEAALEEVRRQRFHIVVLDLMMPGMSGAALYERIRARHPATSCIFISGKPSFLVEETLEGYKGSGARVEFIRKPFDISELEECIERMARNHLEAAPG